MSDNEPALVPETFREFASRVTCPRCSHHKACYCDSRCDEACCSAGSPVVPAATDDEAATEVITLALKPALHEPLATVVAKANAEYVIAALRSAGFRIVYDNTEAPR